MSNPALPALAVAALAGIAIFIWLLVSAAFLLWGARIAGTQTRSLGRALGTILLGGVASAFLRFVLSSAAPVVGTGLGILLGFTVSALVTMALFDTTFGKAFVANPLAWLLSLAVLVVLAFLFVFLAAFLAAAAV